MATTLVRLVAGPLGNGYQPVTWQELIAHAMDVSHGEIDINGINFGDTEPDPANRDKLWFRMSGDELDRVYSYFTAAGTPGWYARNQVPASGDERRLWVGDTTDLKVYDGGVDEAVTDIAGPMWEVDTDFAGRVPVGPGTLDSGGAFETVVDVGDTGGVGEIQMAAAGAPALATANDFDRTGGGTGAIGSYVGTASAPMNNMPRYRGIYIIKRTARIYYVPS